MNRRRFLSKAWTNSFEDNEPIGEGEEFVVPNVETMDGPVEQSVDEDLHALESAQEVIAEMEERIEESESKLGATVGGAIDGEVQEGTQEEPNVGEVNVPDGNEATTEEIQEQVMTNEKSMESWSRMMGFNNLQDFYSTFGIDRKAISFESMSKLPKESLAYSVEGIKEGIKGIFKAVKDMIKRIIEWLSKSFQIIFRAIFSYEKAVESLKKAYKEKIEGKQNLKLKDGTKYSPLTIVLQKVNVVSLNETGVRFSEVLAKAQAFANTHQNDIKGWTGEVVKFIEDVCGDYKKISKEIVKGFKISFDGEALSEDDPIVLGIYNKNHLFGYPKMEKESELRIPRMNKIEISYEDGDFSEFNKADGRAVAQHLGEMLDCSQDYIKSVKTEAKKFSDKVKVNVDSLKNLSYFKDEQPNGLFGRSLFGNQAESQMMFDPQGYINKQLNGTQRMLGDITRLGRIYQTSPGLILSSLKEVFKSIIVDGKPLDSQTTEEVEVDEIIEENQNRLRG